jgi:plasmid stabilization system protein ParE
VIREVIRGASADRDYQRIVSWLAEYDPLVARRFQIEYRLMCNRLGQFSSSGTRYMLDTGEEVRKARVGSFRKYLVFYREEENTLRVLRIIHSSQDVTTELKSDAGM